MKEQHHTWESRLQVIEENRITPNEEVIYIPPNQTQPIQQNIINEPTNLNLSPQESEIVDLYDRNPVLIARQAREVSETKNSIEQRQQGYNIAVILEKRNNANYWLIAKDQLYVIPRKHLSINRVTLESLLALFDYQDIPNKKKFKLLKPAKAVLLTGSQNWQITERGVIKFELN